MRLESIGWLTADTAWLLLVGGVLLIYWELCRPGRVIAGAAGGACVLLALAKFSTLTAGFAAPALLLAAAVASLAAEAAWRWPGIVGAGLLSAAAVTAGVRWMIAVPAAMVLAYTTAVLGHAALRARRNKRV